MFNSQVQVEIADQLSARGFFIGPQFFSKTDIYELRSDFEQARALGKFRRAGVGKGAEFAVQDQIRRDEIMWIDRASANSIQAHLLNRIDEFRQVMNGPPHYMGLSEFEGHYAHYPAGGFYQRHLDQLKGDSSRVLSMILYLNESWQFQHGGQLRLYLPPGNESAFVDVEPRAGTLVCFLSADFEHEVLPSYADRFSFTGWFKTQSI